MCQGWIKLHRSITEWEWYSDINTSRLFLHIMLTANHKNKRWKGMEIPAGSIVTSVSHLSEQTALSVMQVRTCLKRLKSTNELTIKTTSNYTLITITNWDSFQEDNKQSNKRITNEQQTDNKRITTTKECKNVRREEEVLCSDFEELWKEYKPYETLKGPKQKAKDEFIKAIKKGESYERIRSGLRSYIEFTQRTGTKTKAVYGWLKDQRWKDDYTTTIPNQPSGSNSGESDYQRRLREGTEEGIRLMDQMFNS